MYVSGSSSATRGPPTPARPLAQATAVALAPATETPAPRELFGDRKADVVTGGGVLAAGVAEADDEPVDRRAAREAQGLLAVV